MLFARERHVRHLLFDYIDGCLKPSAARRVERHLAGCLTCAQELEQWRAMLHLVSLHTRVPCPIDCADAVLPRLEANPCPLHVSPSPRVPAAIRSRSRFRANWATVAAALLLLLGGWHWYHTASTRQPYPVAGRAPALAAPVPAAAPDRLDGAFGRSDSLILASDFVEGEL